MFHVNYFNFSCYLCIKDLIIKKNNYETFKISFHPTHAILGF
jgi:hypothetical protein